MICSCGPAIIHRRPRGENFRRALERPLTAKESEKKPIATNAARSGLGQARKMNENRSGRGNSGKEMYPRIAQPPPNHRGNPREAGILNAAEALIRADVRVRHFFNDTRPKSWATATSPNLGKDYPPPDLSSLGIIFAGSRAACFIIRGFFTNSQDLPFNSI